MTGNIKRQVWTHDGKHGLPEEAYTVELYYTNGPAGEAGGVALPASNHAPKPVSSTW